MLPALMQQTAEHEDDPTCRKCGRRVWELDTTSVVESHGTQARLICRCGGDRWVLLKRPETLEVVRGKRYEMQPGIPCNCGCGNVMEPGREKRKYRMDCVQQMQAERLARIRRRAADPAVIEARRLKKNAGSRIYRAKQRAELRAIRQTADIERRGDELQRAVAGLDVTMGRA